MHNIDKTVTTFKNLVHLSNIFYATFKCCMCFFVISKSCLNPFKKAPFARNSTMKISNSKRYILHKMV